MKALKISVLSHLLLLAAIGCAAHKPLVVDLSPRDTEIENAQSEFNQITRQIPRWEADGLGRYEQDELTLVKQDLLKMTIPLTREEFLILSAKLHADWEALGALDAALSRNILL